MERRIDRRTLLWRTAATGLIAAATPRTAWALAPTTRITPGGQTDSAAQIGELVIDLAAEPPSLDPAVVYDADGWSVVHAVYDSLVQYDRNGQLEPLLAESLTLLDPLTWEIKLRRGIAFHNGEPLDARSVAFSIGRLGNDATTPQISGFFGPRTIRQVEEVDPTTVLLHLVRPAPWLPAQMAAWLALLPPVHAAASGAEIAANPIGTGPFRFVGWERGSQIELEANPDYFAASPKGRPLARRVVYRFVPEASTRVADLLAGTAGVVRSVPVDQVEAVRRGAAGIRAESISGSAWIRIPTDVAPFSDVRVRRALNHAVDVDAIVQALLGGNGRRLANFFVPDGLGHDPDLTPIAFDPDAARSLLTEAGYPGGFETSLAYASTERGDLVAAVAGQLEEIGVRARLQPVESATFNETWQDPSVAPLRFATWRPLFDPYTLLGLVVSSDGFLSRHDNPLVQPLIDAAAMETDGERRAQLYRELGRALRDEPAAIYLYDLTALTGVADAVPNWSGRTDDYLIPTARG